jgi:hypothetical protein
MAPRLRPSIAAAALLALAAGCTRGEGGAPRPARPASGVAEADAGAPPAVAADPLARLIEDAQGDGGGPFATPSAEDMAAFAAIVEHLAAASAAPLAPTATASAGPVEASIGLPPAFASIADWNAQAQRLGLELVLARERERAPETIVLVREIVGIRRGGGVYALRARPLAPGRAALVIEAPHCFFDTGTGPIAREVFERTGALALALNTVHRYLGKEKPPPGVSPADVAHAERSYFQAFTVGASRALARAAFVQIHGFAAEAHPELAGIELVASKGTAAGVEDRVFDGLVRRLRAALGAKEVAVFGRETRSLGATENAQGRFLNGYSDDLFYHLEMSRALRARLGADEGLRARFADALRPLAEEPR